MNVMVPPFPLSPFSLQEDAGCFVHKQGFLVKQGGKVKNWKKRLFVLDSDGLSYFKTEQVATRVIRHFICYGSALVVHYTCRWVNESCTYFRPHLPY